MTKQNSKTFDRKASQTSSSDNLEFIAFANAITSYWPIFHGPFLVNLWSDSSNLVSIYKKIDKGQLSKGAMRIFTKMDHIFSELTAKIVFRHISGKENIADSLSRIYIRSSEMDPRKQVENKMKYSTPVLDKAKLGSLSQYKFLPKTKPTNQEMSSKKELVSNAGDKDDQKVVLSTIAEKEEVSKAEEEARKNESIVEDLLQFHRRNNHIKGASLKQEYIAQKNHHRPIPMTLVKLAVGRCSACLSLPQKMKSGKFNFFNLLAYCPNALVQMDAGTYLKRSGASSHFMVIADQYSKFSKVYGLVDHTSQSYLKVLRTWIHHYGAPYAIKTDNALGFKSVFEKYCDFRSIELKKCVPEIHSGNSLAENRINLVKKFIAVNLADPDPSNVNLNPFQRRTVEWDDLLDEVFTFSNNVKRKFTNPEKSQFLSPTELFLHRMTRPTHREPTNVRSYTNLPVDDLDYNHVFESQIFSSIERHEVDQQPPFKVGALLVRRNKDMNLKSRKFFRLDEIFRCLEIEGNHAVVKHVLDKNDAEFKIVAHAHLFSPISVDQLKDLHLNSNFDLDRIERKLIRNPI